MKCQRGFSLVEVALALGLVSFALVTLLALLPVGLRTNRTSVEEIRATCLLSMLEADLRNSDPTTNGGKSLMLGLRLPYAVDVNGRRIFNPAVTPVTALDASVTTGLDESERPVPPGTSPPPRFQASVVYTKIPPAGSRRPVEAVLIVHWPASTSTVIPGTSAWSNVAGGYVATVTAFPSP